MAGAIGVAAALAARRVTITCPHCGYRQRVERTPVAVRVCRRCRRQLPAPDSVSAQGPARAKRR